MKKFSLITFLLLLSTNSIGATCTCSKGKMTVEITDSGVSMSCSDGGRPTCTH